MLPYIVWEGQIDPRNPTSIYRVVAIEGKCSLDILLEYEWMEGYDAMHTKKWRRIHDKEELSRINDTIIKDYFGSKLRGLKLAKLANDHLNVP